MKLTLSHTVNTDNEQIELSFGLQPADRSVASPHASLTLSARADDPALPVVLSNLRAFVEAAEQACRKAQAVALAIATRNLARALETRGAQTSGGPFDE